MSKFNNYDRGERVAYGDSDAEQIDVTPLKPLPVTHPDVTADNPLNVSSNTNDNTAMLLSELIAVGNKILKQLELITCVEIDQ